MKFLLFCFDLFPDLQANMLQFGTEYFLLNKNQKEEEWEVVEEDEEDKQSEDGQSQLKKISKLSYDDGEVISLNTIHILTS